MTPRRLLLCAGLAAALGGCALLPSFSHHRLELRPASSQLTLSSRRDDGYYASAKTAIARRDYALALDLLQAARAINPDDPRILNAFGVVYDKLSRFDLSARYYAQASARDPGSLIVASNMAWSAALQARAAAAPETGAVQQGVLALSAPEPVEQRQATASARPVVVRLGFAAPQPAAEPAGGVVVENVSGRPEAAGAVAQGLRRLGWTSRIEAAPGPSQPASTITYPSARAEVARALAKTLAVRIQLVDCGSECDRIRLTLGHDAATWSLARNDLRERRK